LADIALPVEEGWGRTARETALIVGFALFIALFARFSLHLPFAPAPITRQTFAVLLTGASAGSWRGAAGSGGIANRWPGGGGQSGDSPGGCGP
jgi:hypothetical protein